MALGNASGNWGHPSCYDSKGGSEDNKGGGWARSSKACGPYTVSQGSLAQACLRSCHALECRHGNEAPSSVFTFLPRFPHLYNGRPPHPHFATKEVSLLLQLPVTLEGTEAQELRAQGHTCPRGLRQPLVGKGWGLGADSILHKLGLRVRAIALEVSSKRGQFLPACLPAPWAGAGCVLVPCSHWARSWAQRAGLTRPPPRAPGQAEL